ncbi:helix-turn-helix transcriptional regulator [Nocardia terpenica]|uniref:Helix-turn-helix transcriptional regulator n=1 Tax=Nocardia terpenica TaxID=455432 RepID=A0A164K8T9_9NOCA|nr:helix-turn-helix transcriptional regulator [Nocardia terpenica]KZM71155.1 helix-turn-helix transcriptional regulator [Nocardia terpenica]MBF6062706.1 helix-turn-helix transcriptional regulator [Nocardia terpenica]MBF6105159.1 helix-turn-helix transcriptional regulator [Nocardia terpenica]MBF6112404.1 helix-turn-helix transcriptional regulator [Nocardia terpenica]MBF6118887.1 helix-turn-helix transcriptional regulator [Nocardia terpenica]
MARNWPMIERGSELDSIRAALTGTEFVGAVLTGDAGVGKTTLARQATAAIGGNIRWVAGTESARSIPLGVFAHMVGVYTAHDPVTFMAAAREALLADGHTIIGVDDAHLLDQLSATLLLQLAIDKAAHIVCTVRSGVPVPDAVTSLWKDGHLLRIDLTPFSQRQSVQLVESMLGGQLEGFTANLMWESSGGNALFLRHLVEGALEAGTLRQVNGVWQLRGRAAVTSELAALLEDRVEQLPDPVLRVLELLTFCEPIDLDVLSELAGEEAVETAESRSVIRIVENTHQLLVRYNHPLFGEVIRRRLGIASARRLRGRLYSSLRERPIDSASDRIRLAELALDSDKSADLELFVAAAEDAIGLANIPLGERFARAAVERRGGVEAADLLARALLWQGHRIEAERTLASFDPEQLNDVQLTRWGSTRVSNLLWAMGDADRADEVLALVRERVTHPKLAATLRGLSSACAVNDNRLEDAFVDADGVMTTADAPPWAVWWASFGGGLALALMGRGDAARAYAARGHEVEAHIDGLNRFMSTHAEVLALTFTGDLDAARRCATTYFGYSAPGQYLAWGFSKILQGTVDVAQGRFPDGIENLEQALAALHAEGAAAWMFPARIRLAEAYSALGRAAEAAESIAEAIARGGRHSAVYEPQLEIARAWQAAAEGTVTPAVRLAIGAADAAARSHQHAIEARALHTAARFGDHSVAGRLADLAARIDGKLVQVQARHAVAVASHDGPGLDNAAAEFEALGALLSAADAAAQAASAHERSGDRRRLLESAATANRLAAACGGASTPALRQSAQPLPLTAREREIANLVAAGLTNRQIADRLTVSVRTVEGHLYRACIKLDVTDREALAELMRGEPPSGKQRG